MEQSRQVGTSGLRITPVGLGTATFGREVSAADARELTARYLDAGGNHIDTADSYGRGTTERILGRALRGRRDGVVLAGKVGLPLRPGPDRNRGSRRHIIGSVEATLTRLRTDRLDVLYSHRWDGETVMDETLAAFSDLVTRGLVHHVAFSNWTAWQMAWAMGIARARGLTIAIAAQGRYSLAERDVEREILPYCRWQGLGFVAYSPLCGGLLSGKYVDGSMPSGSRGADLTLGESLRRRANAATTIVDAVRKAASEVGVTSAQLAIAWALDRPGLSGLLIGVTSQAQLDEALAAAELRIDPAVLRQLSATCAFSRGYPHDLLTELGCDGPEAIP